MKIFFRLLKTVRWFDDFQTKSDEFYNWLAESNFEIFLSNFCHLSTKIFIIFLPLGRCFHQNKFSFVDEIGLVVRHFMFIIYKRAVNSWDASISANKQTAVLKGAISYIKIHSSVTYTHTYNHTRKEVDIISVKRLKNTRSHTLFFQKISNKYIFDRFLFYFSAWLNSFWLCIECVSVFWVNIYFNVVIGLNEEKYTHARRL